MIKRVLSLVVISSLIFSSLAFAEVEKEEWVYVNSDINGQVKEITVNNWLHSEEKEVEVTDISILKNIKNLKSDEVPKLENTKITWDIKDHDIYYQGTTDKELPFSMEVTYLLNDEIVNPKDILSKSGSLEIHFKSTNKHLINHDDKELYLPISIISVINLPNEIFKNVKINSGKLVNDGDRQIVTYLSLPGLKENMKAYDFEDDYFDIPEELVIKAEVENFEMQSIYSTATTEVPKLNDFDDFNKLDEFVEGVDLLADSSKKLLEGTTKLSSGQKILNENLLKFSTGFDLLTTNIPSLKQGATNLSNGANGLSDAQKKVVIGLNKSRLAVEQLKAAKVKELEFTKKSYEALKVVINGLEGLHKISNKEVEGKPFIDGLKKHLLGLEMINVSGLDYLAGLEALNLGLADIEVGASTIESKLGELATGGQTLSSGINALEGGITKLTSASKQLVDGSNSLTSGMKSLNQNMQKFNDEGIVEFTDGISEVTNSIGDIEGFKDSITFLSNNYKLYSGSNEGVKNTSKFIIKTDELQIIKEVNEVVKESTEEKDEKSFIDWIKNLF